MVMKKMTSQANTIQALIKPKFARPLKHVELKEKAFKLLSLPKTQVSINQADDKALNRIERYHTEAIVQWNRFNRVR